MIETSNCQYFKEVLQMHFKKMFSFVLFRMLNFITKQGASSAQTLGVVGKLLIDIHNMAVMYTAFACAVTLKSCFPLVEFLFSHERALLD